MPPNANSTPLVPLARRSVVDEAYEALSSRVLHGVWAPGDKLPTEQELATALGVGRSTVREALNRLASAGLITIPHGGTKRVLEWRDHAGLAVLSSVVVSPEGEVSLAAVRSVTELRGVVAPDVARLAAARRSDEDAAALVEIASALEAEGDLVELLEATLSWWTILVRASDNLAYRLAYNTLRSTYREGRPLLIQVIEEELRAVQLYREVSRAVTEREAELAESSCRALVRLGSDALFAAMALMSGD